MGPNDPEEQARQRAEVIVKVQSGQLTATQAARRMGVSRKTYYQWERRALAGMIEALQDKDGGRPATPRDPEKQQMRERLADLEEREKVRQQVDRIREAVDEATTPAQKK
jgi:transposase